MAHGPIFWWIDDDASRIGYFRRVLETPPPGFRRGARVEFRKVTKNVLADVAMWSTSSAPALLIVDHVFSKAGVMPLRGLVGSSVAHLLRKPWPQVPIVCVTAMLDVRRGDWFDQEDLSEYTALFSYSKLDDHVDDLYVIARDFPKLMPKGQKLREHLLKRLGVPNSDAETFLAALPDEFQSQLHPTTHHRLARWIFNVFLKRPGFLYDRLRAATYLGLTEKGFRKVERLFEDARYNGPFVVAKRPCWWVARLQEILFERVTSAESSQLAGRALPGIKSVDHSRCYVSNTDTDIPDAVAQLYPRGEWKAVCSRYTKAHPRYPAALPGFETLLAVSNKK